MGWGDELMAAGEARLLHRRTGHKIGICAGRWRGPLASVLWRGIDYIAQPGEPFKGRVIDSPKRRPYRRASTPLGSVWREYRPVPAEIAFSQVELDFADRCGRGFVVVEPHVKSEREGAVNRQWGWPRYAAVLAGTPDLRWVQFGMPGAEILPGATHIETPTFRTACAVLARAAAYVGPEGGLHHACAAVGTLAIVIFGGYISPRVTGYPEHVNLFSGEGLGCGRRLKCQCNCMESILPSTVIEALGRILSDSRS